MAAGGSAECVDLTGEEEDAERAEEEEADEGLRQQLAEVDDKLAGVEAEMQALAAQRASLRQRRAELAAGLKDAARARSGAVDWQSASFAREADALACLRDTFKLPAFRGLQRGVLNATLSGVDALVIMPAGGGKSICYQLPAVLEARGFTLVVSPLLSLIDDQVMALRALGVHAAELTAGTPADKAAATQAALDDPKSTLRLLYVTPEKIIKSRRFFAKLEKAYKAGLLRRIAIDEAHCISQWGCDFRADYLKLSVLKKQFPKAPILALTATATPDVQSSICDSLEAPAAARFLGSVRRANLRYEVRQKPAAAAAHLDDLAALISRHWPAKAQSGIVYCLSRKETEEVAAQLSSRGISAVCYHANLELPARLAAHRGWAAGRTQVIVATVAFGMGINKVDVRFVIHHSISKSVETYYQESGRAGRDGLPARCIAFFRPADFARQASMVFFEQAGLRRLTPLVRFACCATTCRHAQIASHFGEPAPASCGGCCDVCRPDDDAEAAPPEADLTAHAAALLATAREAEAADRSLSSLQLLEAWRKSGAPERGALARTLRGADGELLVCHCILLGVLRQTFSSTAYTTNVYIAPGPAAAALAAGRLSVRLPLRLQAARKAPAPRKRKAAAAAGDDSGGEAADAAVAPVDDDDDDFQD